MVFLILLKGAEVPARDVISFYLTCIGPVLQYCAPLYHHAPLDYLSNDIERVQKRTLPVISPGPSYLDSLSLIKVTVHLQGCLTCNRCSASGLNCRYLNSYIRLELIGLAIRLYQKFWRKWIVEVFTTSKCEHLLHATSIASQMEFFRLPSNFDSSYFYI